MAHMVLDVTKLPKDPVADSPHPFKELGLLGRCVEGQPSKERRTFGVDLLQERFGLLAGVGYGRRRGCGMVGPAMPRGAPWRSRRSRS